MKFILAFAFLIGAVQSGISQEWGQEQKIIDPNWEVFEEFGYDLVVENNLLYVGVPGGEVNGENAGKVLVYKISSVDSSWRYPNI